MLVNCVAYQNGRKLADIPVSEIHDHLGQPDTFVWVALKDPDAAELDEMQNQFGLHDLAVEDAHHGHQRPKIEEYGESLFVVLHMIETEGDELKVGEVDIFVGSNYVLSVRRQARTRLYRRARALRARAGAPAPRAGLCALCFDGRGRGSLLSDSRRARDRAGAH